MSKSRRVIDGIDVNLFYETLNSAIQGYVDNLQAGRGLYDLSHSAELTQFESREGELPVISIGLGQQLEKLYRESDKPSISAFTGFIVSKNHPIEIALTKINEAVALLNSLDSETTSKELHQAHSKANALLVEANESLETMMKTFANKEQSLTRELRSMLNANDSLQDTDHVELQMHIEAQLTDQLYQLSGYYDEKTGAKKPEVLSVSQLKAELKDAKGNKKELLQKIEKFEALQSKVKQFMALQEQVVDVIATNNKMLRILPHIKNPTEQASHAITDREGKYLAGALEALKDLKSLLDQKGSSDTAIKQKLLQLAGEIGGLNKGLQEMEGKGSAEERYLKRMEDAYYVLVQTKIPEREKDTRSGLSKFFHELAAKIWGMFSKIFGLKKTQEGTPVQVQQAIPVDEYLKVSLRDRSSTVRLHRAGAMFEDVRQKQRSEVETPSPPSSPKKSGG